MIEIPLQHKETGEEFLFCAQSKTSLGAARDFLTQARRVPQGFNPVIRLGVGSFKSKFGQIKKPVLSIVGKVPSTVPLPRRKNHRSTTALNSDACKIWGLDVRVVTACRCGCALIRVHPYSVKSSIPIWKCSWCARRKGKLTETEIKLLESWVHQFGWTLESLVFHENGTVYASCQLPTLRKAATDL